MSSRRRRAARAAIPLALLFVLISAAPAAARSPTKPPRGYCAVNRVDGPIAPGGYAAATGFAVDLAHGAPVRKIELRLDGAPAGEASVRGLRPDVMAHFTRQDYLWSGWSGTVSLEGARPGRHSLGAVAVLRSGERLTCEGPSEILVVDVEDDRDSSPLAVGSVILARTAGFLLLLTLIGWPAAALLRLRPLLLAAPLLGLCLFGVVAEWAAAAKVRPFAAALALGLLAIVAAAWLWRSDRSRLRLNAREAWPTLAAVAAFALIGVIPLSVHGEGAVLGEIDDAVREVSYAESISRYAWNPPAGVQGYLRAVPVAMESISVRRGGTLLLSTLGQLFSARAHEVHSVAMLLAGCLIVVGTGLLASRVLRRFPRRAWIAPALAALNSTLLATLYGQHLGSLLAAALVLPFLYFLLGAPGEDDRGNVLGLGLCSAASLTFYPEATPAWALAGLVAWAAAPRGARATAVKRLLLTAAFVVALNPVGLTRAIRFGSYTSTASREMVSSYNRTTAGDTHYFPSLGVVAGIEAYREDAPSPVGAARRLLIPFGAVGILWVAVLGLRRLNRWEKATLLVLLVPPAIALYANYRLSFPYGFAKFLPFAVGPWCAAFALLVAGAASRRHEARRLWPAALVYTTLLLVFLLALPSARHVVARAVRATPAYDPAFEVLPALAASLTPGAVLRIDEPLVARRDWILYFLGENAVEYDAAGGPVRRPEASGPRVRLVDRRDPDHPRPRAPAITTRYFAVLPLPKSP